MTGFNASASVNDGAADAFVEVDGTVMITLPEEELGEVERTTLKKTNPTKTFAPTLIDGGNLKMEINWTSAQYSRFRTLQRARKLKTIRITGNDQDGAGPGTPEQFEFDGFFKKLSPGSYEREGGRVFSVEFRVNETRFTASGAPNDATA